MRFLFTFKSALAALVLAFSIQACVPTQKPVYASLPGAMSPIEIKHGFSTFLDLCYDNAPDYKNTPKWAAQHGYEKQPNGSYQNTTRYIRFQIKSYETHNACQFMFMSTQPEALFEKIMLDTFHAQLLTEADLKHFTDSEINAKVIIHAYSKIYFASATVHDVSIAKMIGYIIPSSSPQQDASGFKLELLVGKE